MLSILIRLFRSFERGPNWANRVTNWLVGRHVRNLYTKRRRSDL
jgi:hypothetical protein